MRDYLQFLAYVLGGAALGGLGAIFVFGLIQWLRHMFGSF